MEMGQMLIWILIIGVLAAAVFPGHAPLLYRFFMTLHSLQVLLFLNNRPSGKPFRKRYEYLPVIVISVYTCRVSIAHQASRYL
jgi:hypothetical protein